jgi:hypothetical protein
MFEKILKNYDEQLHNHPLMKDQIKAHLAVAEYMLVQIYVMAGENRKAKRHYNAAEDKRNSLDVKVAKSIDWENRMMSQRSPRQPPLPRSHQHAQKILLEGQKERQACYF